MNSGSVAGDYLTYAKNSMEASEAGRVVMKTTVGVESESHRVEVDKCQKGEILYGLVVYGKGFGLSSKKMV